MEISSELDSHIDIRHAFTVRLSNKDECNCLWDTATKAGRMFMHKRCKVAVSFPTHLTH